MDRFYQPVLEWKRNDHMRSTYDFLEGPTKTNPKRGRMSLGVTKIARAYRNEMSPDINPYIVLSTFYPLEQHIRECEEGLNEL